MKLCNDLFKIGLIFLRRVFAKKAATPKSIVRPINVNEIRPNLMMDTK